MIIDWAEARKFFAARVQAISNHTGHPDIYLLGEIEGYPPKLVVNFSARPILPPFIRTVWAKGPIRCFEDAGRVFDELLEEGITSDPIDPFYWRYMTVEERAEVLL